MFGKNHISNFVTLVFFLLSTQLLFSQEDEGNSKGFKIIEISKLPRLDLNVESFPITRDTLGIYPVELYVSGTIVDVSPGALCGILCDCGIIQVDLDRCIPDYRPTCVFVAIPCFAGRKEEYLGKSVKIDLLKLELENSECFWNVFPRNRINSMGIPYYYPIDFEIPVSVE